MIDYTTLDPGIWKTVRLLRSLGLETTDSGDGRTKKEAILEGEALDLPHVFAVHRPDTAIARADRLRWFFDSKPYGYAARIEVNYSPDDGIAIIAVYGIDDALLEEYGEVPEP